MRNKRKGFSMFEMVVALAIVVIAIGIAIPCVQGLIGDTPVKAGADMVKSRWAEARAKAMEQGKPYRFQVMGQHSFRVAPDDDFDGDSKLDDTLPRDVSFDTTQSTAANDGTQSADGSVAIVFLPDGTTSSDAELGLTGQNGPGLTLKLNKSTGTTSANTVAR